MTFGQLKVLSNGNVGISTKLSIGTNGDKFNSPLELIKNGDTWGIDNPVLIIKHSGNGSNIFGNPGTDNGVIRIEGFNSGVDDNMIISNNNFVLKSNGSLGIGTTGPIGLLHVNGNTNKLLRLQNLNGGANNTAAIDFSFSGGPGIGATIQAVDRGNYAADIRFYVNPGTGINSTAVREVLRLNYDGSGHFYGNLYTTQTWLWSDKKLKNNIVTTTNALDKILLLRGVTYEAVDSMDIVETNASQATTNSIVISDSSNIKNTIVKNKRVAFGSGVPNKLQNGFVAQEIEKIFPELVAEKDGYKSVNYTQLIPVIVEALKQQNAIIETLEAKVKKLEKGKSAARMESATNSVESIAGTYLYQNTPNPFSQETQIRYSVPETAANAFITITDLAGKQIKTLSIATKGESFVTVKANELYAGLFAYTLVVDGNIVDTKRMVIVE